MSYKYSSYAQDEPKSRGPLIGIIMGIIILVVIIIVIILLIRSRSGSTGTGSGGDGNGGPSTGNIGSSCTNNSDCSSNVCNSQSGTCVECVDDSTCGTTFPKCKTSSNLCVECLENGDCGAFETCVNDQCCDPRPPEIISAITTLSSNSSIEIGFTLYQPSQSSTIVVILEDPVTGTPLLPTTCQERPIQSCISSATCPPGDQCIDDECVIPGCLSFQAGGNILLLENSTGIKFFAGANYQIKMKTFYTCGTQEEQATTFSIPLSFTMGPCLAQPAAAVINAILPGFIYGPAFNPYFLIIYNIAFGSPESEVGMMINSSPGVHPNLSIYHDANFPIFDDFVGGMVFKYTPVLYNFNPTNFPSGTTIYLKYYRKGPSGNCDGAIGAEFPFLLP